MNLSNLQQIFNLIAWALIAIISAGGLFFGIFALWDGFTNDQPESKKKGITVLIVTVVAVAVLFAAKTIIWTMISSSVPA